MTKRLVIVCIAVIVAALHFLTGPNYQGPFPLFVNGYLIDILLPATLYLLLSLPRAGWLSSPWIRAWAVFGVGCVVEVSQYIGYPLFGSTFDPLDIAAYAGGVLLGVFLDLVLFPRIVPGWSFDQGCIPST